MGRPFDFFEAAELPVPAITAAQAESIAAEHFGLRASATALGSNQDANFLLRTPIAEPIGVLKIANPAFTRLELEAQDAAAAEASLDAALALGHSVPEREASLRLWRARARDLRGRRADANGDYRAALSGDPAVRRAAERGMSGPPP